MVRKFLPVGQIVVTTLPKLKVSTKRASVISYLKIGSLNMVNVSFNCVLN